MKTCKQCGRRLSPLMGQEAWEKRICQDCQVINQIPIEALAKNGLCRLDLM